MNTRTDQCFLKVLSQGVRLNVLAGKQIGDVNEARLLVHGVMARAMNDVCSPVTEHDLDLALAQWRAEHPGDGKAGHRLAH